MGWVQLHITSGCVGDAARTKCTLYLDIPVLATAFPAFVLRSCLIPAWLLSWPCLPPQHALQSAVATHLQRQ